jgi:hypothetical protein
MGTARRKRIAIMVAGYLAACVPVAVVFAIPFLAVLSSDAAFAFGFLLANLVAIAAIIYAERNGLRAVWYYLIGGAIFGVTFYALFAVALIWSAGTAEGFIGSGLLGFLGGVGLLFGVPGAIGGLIYWLVAGRNAGR